MSCRPKPSPESLIFGGKQVQAVARRLTASHAVATRTHRAHSGSDGEGRSPDGGQRPVEVPGADVRLRDPKALSIGQSHDRLYAPGRRRNRAFAHAVARLRPVVCARHSDAHDGEFWTYQRAIRMATPGALCAEDEAAFCRGSLEQARSHARPFKPEALGQHRAPDTSGAGSALRWCVAPVAPEDAAAQAQAKRTSRRRPGRCAIG